MTVRRKLAAILFADIAGFTRQVNQDEVAGLEWRRRVERLIKDCGASHDGRVVKTIGDAVMLEFGSAVEAVTCALAIQEQMDTLNVEAALPAPLQVRVGIHVGDVVEEENDLYGNAVNIASRVHDMAPPGGICITREVYVQIRPILKLRCDPVKTPSRKPMPEPIEVFRVIGEPSGEHAPNRVLMAKPTSPLDAAPPPARLQMLVYILGAGAALLLGVLAWRTFRPASEANRALVVMRRIENVDSAPSDSLRPNAGPLPRPRMSGGDGPRRQVTTANRQNEPQAGATSQTDPALEKKRFTLTLENTDQYEALKQLFQQAGVSYVLESETRGPKVTINLKNQPFSVALKTLLNASEQPLAYRVENGVYRVAPLRQRRPGIGRRSAEVSDSSPVILVETARPGASPTASEPDGEVRTSVILPQIAKPPLPPAVPPPTMDGER